MRWVFAFLLFQRSVDEKFCYCKIMSLGLCMDNSSSPPNAQTFAEFCDLLGREHKNISNCLPAGCVVSLLICLLLASSAVYLMQHSQIIHQKMS